MTKAVIAFSGGLDTTYLAHFVREAYGIDEVVTCCVDTGGFSDEEIASIEDRANQAKADKHIYMNASQEFYDEIIKYLIFGHVRRDQYPLCVGAERLIQARGAINTCLDEGAEVLIHGSTGAGNDQYRFDTVAYVLGQRGVEGSNKNIKVLAPIRDKAVSREESKAYLEKLGIKMGRDSTYSVNQGLWGTSIGGAETFTSDQELPEEAWLTKITQDKPAEITIEFEKGEAVKAEIDGEKVEGPVNIIRKLGLYAGSFGIGRHYHIGTSMPGRKGRLGYESPAADVLYAAHRTLESITLTQQQIHFKPLIANEFGRLVHEAQVFDPFIDDCKAYLQQSQERVTGTATVKLDIGRISHIGVDSPYNLLTVDTGKYGESSVFYDGKDAEGSAILHSHEQALYHRLKKTA